MTEIPSPFLLKQLLLILCLIADSFCQEVVSYGYIGERTDISCRYPPQYSSKTKTFCKVSETGICNAITTGPGQRFGFEDDKFSKVATLTLRRVADGDSGLYRCGFGTNGDRVDIQSIQFWELSNIGYEGGEVTFKCTYAQGFQTKDKYFYKRDASSDYLVETKNGETRNTNGRASLQDSKNFRVFTVTLQNLTANDTGKYCCGMKRGGEEPNHLSERRLIVKSVLRVFGYIGGKVILNCPYQNEEQWRGNKHFCKGKEPVQCLQEGSVSEERFSFNNTDNITTTGEVFTVTIADLRAEDAGIYWCVEFGEAGGPEFTSAVDLRIISQ